MLGHELRNPLAPILTALQLMTLRRGNGERERAVIDRQVRHLMRLVDDLLDVSRISRGKIELRHRTVDLADIVGTAIETASPLLEERHHHLTVDVPRGLLVRGDPTRLAQVMSNVVSNAAKYTEPRGHLRIGGQRTGDAIELKVKDDGIGIPADMLDRVFDMFAQDRQAIDRVHGGLGLGLTIAKSLVEMHGGSVRALSEGPGKGSEFVIRLPAATDASAGAAEPWPVENAVIARARRRILVVDDNVDAARLMAEALEAVGHEIRLAFDGPGALDAAVSFKPDVALLDLGLPLMDGYEIARHLIAASSVRPPVLVAVTGYGQTSDRERTRSAGFHAHVVKPVDLSYLIKLLDDVLAAQTAERHDPDLPRPQ
jgi:CheY-like chemotaxis protein